MTATTTESPIQTFRLSPNVVPQKYELLIKVLNFDPFKNPSDNVPVDYYGEVAITLQLKEPKNTIILHVDQTITVNRTLTLQNLDSSTFYAVTHSTYDSNVDLYQIQTSNSALLPAGLYKLSISFLSETKLDGFFKSNYDEFGTSRFKKNYLFLLRI